MTEDLHAIIVDDEAGCREALATDLQLYCPEVKVLAICRSAEEGLDSIRTTAPDCVFLDIVMPGMSGFAMLDRLGHIDFEVIFMSAYQEYAMKALQYGAAGYLLKPFSRHELTQAVGVVFNRRRVDS